MMREDVSKLTCYKIRLNWSPEYELAGAGAGMNMVVEWITWDFRLSKECDDAIVNKHNSRELGILLGI